MPEEQAFILLCRLMEDQRYLLREMYKANFENLQLRFHQLTCLIEENLGDLAVHFYDLKVECHMFASQWFLTLFSAKFPLYLVFRIMDLFLYEVRHIEGNNGTTTVPTVFLGFQCHLCRCVSIAQSRMADQRDDLSRDDSLRLGYVIRF